MIRKVLIADDESMDRQLMQDVLLTIDDSLDVTTASDGQEACDLLRQDFYDLVFTDLRMPQGSGLDVLAAARSGERPVDVVIVTGHDDVPTAVEAMRNGSYDYLLKPICVDQVELLMGRLREHTRLLQENEYLHSELAAARGMGDIVGESPAIMDVCAKARHVAAADATVLLQGESGTGKELVSRLIHKSSPRCKGPFVRVNCAALSESILESELFGHEKGAFTGAYTSKLGRFELADGGTLLLDEITETSEKLQAELLRVIEAKEFERVGGTRTVRVDVRLIATTNRDLTKQVAEGKFREDLFFRLNVVPLVVPPLRDREGDVDLLCAHFIDRFAKRMGRPELQIDPEAMAVLRRHPWPGNVRELENLMHRLAIMVDATVITAADLPLPLTVGAGPLARGRFMSSRLEDVERELILDVLQQVNGNRTRAAERLDISTRTIRNKLRRYREEGSLREKCA